MTIAGRCPPIARCCSCVERVAVRQARQAIAVAFGLAVCTVSPAVLAQSGAVAPQKSVQVLAVNNGQELLVEIDGQGLTLRLSCLQAPRPQQQPWAEQATVALAKEAPVGSRWQFQLRARDVYGRLVGTLQRNGQDLAAPLLRQGRVFAYDGFLGRCDDLPYARWQREAAAQRLGVWSVPGGITRPWDQREQTAAAERLAP
jgi:micrococcal nuclease